MNLPNVRKRDESTILPKLPENGRPFGTRYPFDDTDVFKIIEGASYSLQVLPDPGLSATSTAWWHLFQRRRKKTAIYIPPAPSTPKIRTKWPERNAGQTWG